MKKICSLILALVLCFSLIPCAFAIETVSASDKFTDVPANAWYLNELNYALANGYISGTSATTFSPDGNLTRGQFVTIFGRMVGVQDMTASENALRDMGFTVELQEKFVDVKFGSYYYYYVDWAAAYDFMNGVSTDRFSPDTFITVEQMGTAFANFLNKSGVELDNFKPGVTYADASSISAWASESMMLMQRCGLLVVDDDGNVNPHKYVTRAECVVSIVRLAKLLHLGVVPVSIQKSDTAETAAKKVHDALWSAGVLNSNMTQKEKAGVYLGWLAGVCGYDYNGVNSKKHSAYGALVDGLAVCDGYTGAYNLLLETEGIECSCAETPDHMWTVATLDGVLYHIDATNCDQGTYASYEYFCMTPEEAWELINSIQGSFDSAGEGVIVVPDTLP